MGLKECIPLWESTEKDQVRFWPKVDRRSDSECWLWKGGASSAGYGHFVLSPGNRCVKAHRMAYFFGHGVDPGARLVCHKCDVKLCCNPSHLFLGDHRANAWDATSKGRMNWKDDHLLRKHPELVRRGERIGMGRLTEADVIEMRRLWAEGLSRNEISAKLGMHYETVSKIVKRQRWQHIVP